MTDKKTENMYCRLRPYLYKNADLSKVDMILNDVIEDKLKAKFVGKKFQITGQRDILDYFKVKVGESKIEKVYCLFLDAKNRILCCEHMNDGTLTQSVVYPREIAKRAMDLGALSVVLYHNHPSGIVTASEADKTITKKLMFGLLHLDIQLLDHIIVGEDKYYSFYEEGLIERYKSEHKNMMENLI